MGVPGPARDQATERMPVANVKQPVTDDSIKVRQLTHYQFSWVAGKPAEPGTYTLQLVLDDGAVPVPGPAHDRRVGHLSTDQELSGARDPSGPPQHPWRTSTTGGTCLLAVAASAGSSSVPT